MTEPTLRAASDERIARNDDPATGYAPPGRRVVTASLAFLLFLAATVFLMWFQERSVLLTCLKLPGMDLSTCLPGDVLSATGGTESEPARNAIASALGASLDPAETRFAVQIGLLGAVAGGAIALMLLVLFPADVLKFDGSFKHGGGNLRFGGAVGVFLLVTAGAGYLAYRSIPSETQFKSARAAAIRSQEAAALMHANYAQLIRGLGEKQHDYARNLLVHGYFRKMRGTYVIHCDIESANQSATRARTDEPPLVGPGTDLRVRFGSQETRPHVNFDIPIETLSPDTGSTGKSVVNMKLERSVNDLNLVDLSRTTFDIRETSLASGLNDSILYVRTEINQGQLERYCADRGPPAAAASKTRGEF